MGRMRANAMPHTWVSPSTLMRPRARLGGFVLTMISTLLAKRNQQAHQALAGEVRKAAIQQGRDLRLVDAHESSRRDLREVSALNGLPDMAGKLSLGQFLLGFGEAQIGKYIAAARAHRDFRASLLDHCV